MISLHKPALRASLSFIALLAPASAVQAQSASDDITVTATRENKSASDSQSSSSVVNRETLKMDPRNRIGDTLATIPNVDIQANVTDPGTSVNVRGLQDFGRVAITVDGARQNFQR